MKVQEEANEQEILYSRAALDFSLPCCGILTIVSWEAYFPRNCFTGQNGTFSTTKQNGIFFSLSFQYYFWQSNCHCLHSGVYSARQIRINVFVLYYYMFRKSAPQTMVLHFRHINVKYLLFLNHGNMQYPVFVLR